MGKQAVFRIVQMFLFFDYTTTSQSMVHIIVKRALKEKVEQYE